MKASEIFLNFAAPVYSSTLANVSQEELKKILMVPELVWNAVVLDRNQKRRNGDMPEHLKDHLQTMGVRYRKLFREQLRFWVLRKDREFAQFNWPISVTVYVNVKGELIIRCEVMEQKGVTPNVPVEWLKEKPIAPIFPLHRSTE